MEVVEIISNTVTIPAGHGFKRCQFSVQCEDAQATFTFILTNLRKFLTLQNFKVEMTGCALWSLY